MQIYFALAFFLAPEVFKFEIKIYGTIIRLDFCSEYLPPDISTPGFSLNMKFEGQKIRSPFDDL